jgi:hypothetical protein
LTNSGVGRPLEPTPTALLGYAYGADDLYQLPMFNTMALGTSVAMFALAIAILSAAPESGAAWVLSERDRAANAFTRSLLGFACLVPVAGWGLVTALQTGRLAPAAAMALLVVATVAASRVADPARRPAAHGPWRPSVLNARGCATS